MNRQIAIISHTLNTDYSDYTKVIESITNWSEVTEEEFQLLKKYQYKNSHIQVLERLDVGGMIPNTVEEYLQKAKTEEEKRIKAEAEKTRKAEAARLKKLANKEAQEKDLLKKLMEKHGEPK